MIPTLGQNIWLKSGKSTIAYYYPSIFTKEGTTESDQYYNIRPTIYTAINAIKLGTITDTDQSDLENSNTKFIEFQTPEGEYRYVRKENFDLYFEVLEPETSTTQTLINTVTKSYLMQSILGLLGLVFIGVGIWAASRKKTKTVSMPKPKKK